MVRLPGRQRRDRQEHGQPRELPGARGLHRHRQRAASCASAVTTAGRRARSPPAAGISHILHGSDVTINDPTPPTVTVEASRPAGRRRAQRLGPRHRDGDRRRRHPPGRPARRDEPGRPGGRRHRGLRRGPHAAPTAICDYSLPAPCPSLSRETIQAAALPAGQRSRGRARDRHRRQRRRQRPVPGVRRHARPTAARSTAPTRPTPATLSLIWTKGAQGRAPHAQLRPQGGRPRPPDQRRRRADRRRQGPAAHARPAPRRHASSRARRFTTDGDGRFRTTVTASASRQLQFAWLVARQRHPLRRQRLPDAAGARVRDALRSPRAARASGARSRSAGSLRGVARGGVPVVVQGRAARLAPLRPRSPTPRRPASGRFKVRYRFRNAASRGRSFVFRARIRPAPRFPYETGYSKTVTVRVRVCSAGEVGSLPCTVTGGESVDDLLRHGRHRLHRAPPRRAAARARG